eukprot:CAMPEP_0206487340 /NCGR_PEP_ID=MMETSP0324_2-20121206/41571_1 /ASSEMBLY_ACC=CAM_ASM_000836 /TAXON_ID=2866 /ORGANISM="Crypthecodinium cohnii, Strain Seligo" /LENGTH=30 /DNA_ID= /DNA_START= /DNA_END= /DNA_ORIENTATION=
MPCLRWWGIASPSKKEDVVGNDSGLGPLRP